ncbi:MAG: hypothetical protein P0S95_06770 [Rhabdochlamydiaceae bacterium]|nr:hypothetical protein [Candidatus Amphrikana amoebophyrae]
MISVIVLIIAVLAAFSIIYFTFKNGISPMPSSKKVCAEIAKLVSEEKVVHELGSGFGHLAFAIAKANLNCKVIAYENSFIPFFYTYLVSHMLRLKNIKVILGDFWKLDFSQFECVVAYQYIEGVQRLYLKMESETNNGLKFITNTFSVHKTKCNKKVYINDISNSVLFCYKVEPRLKSGKLHEEII